MQIIEPNSYRTCVVNSDENSVNNIGAQRHWLFGKREFWPVPTLKNDCQNSSAMQNRGQFHPLGASYETNFATLFIHLNFVRVFLQLEYRIWNLCPLQRALLNNLVLDSFPLIRNPQTFPWLYLRLRMNQRPMIDSKLLKNARSSFVCGRDLVKLLLTTSIFTSIMMD